MQVNEYLVSFSKGFIPIDQELEIGDQVRADVEFEVDKIEIQNNHDGTVNKIYKLKGFFATIKHKDKIISDDKYDASL